MRIWIQIYERGKKLQPVKIITLPDTIKKTDKAIDAHVRVTELLGDNRKYIILNVED